jgi:phage tail sheath protein FI
MLGGMHARGAFAGTTAVSSFQVVTDPSLNTAAARDQGRFIVELRVAPSLPLTFLTVRLIQSGDQLTVREGR